MKGEGKPSFCEQKEAKKLCLFARGRHRLLAHKPRRPPPPMDEVFLLLFVHKKKTLPSLPGTPA